MAATGANPMSMIAFLAQLRLRPRISLARRIARLVALHRTRRALALLEPHLLRDIGLEAQTARREAARRAWDAPEHWFDRLPPR